MRDRPILGGSLSRRGVLAGGAALLTAGMLPGGAGAAGMEAPMPLVVDASERCSDAAADLARAGVKAVVRYYARAKQDGLEEKILTAAEAKALFDAGLAVALCYQHRSGRIESFEEEAAEDAARYCLGRDARQGKRHEDGLIYHPDGAVIYFGIDANFPPVTEVIDERGRVQSTVKNDEIIKRFFTIINERFKNKPFQVGVYGPGRFCRMLAEAKLASHFWLPGSTGWAETPAFYNGERKVPAWHLYQKAVEVPFEFRAGGDRRAAPRTLRIDVNILNPRAGGKFGAFKGRELIGPLDDTSIREGQRFLIRNERFLKTPGGEPFTWNVERGSGKNRRIESTNELAARKMVTLLGVADDKRWARVEAISTERNSLQERENGVVRVGYVPTASLTVTAKMPT